jgi:hypothetical protein
MRGKLAVAAAVGSRKAFWANFARNGIATTPTGSAKGNHSALKPRRKIFRLYAFWAIFA